MRASLLNFLVEGHVSLISALWEMGRASGRRGHVLVAPDVLRGLVTEFHAGIHCVAELLWSGDGLFAVDWAEAGHGVCYEVSRLDC